MSKEPNKYHMDGVAEGRKQATATYKDLMVSEIKTRISMKKLAVEKLYAEIKALESIKRYAERISG